MKYYILNGTFRPDRPEGPAFKAALDAHHGYLAPMVASGKILVSGPKPGGGGVILLKAEDMDEVQAIIAGDPFVVRGVQTYEVAEFKPVYVQPEVKEWFSA
ncbi:MAG: YciI family protein [Evtepia sp.]